jgi:glycosyltransferase involved in cell wall biosynthesis
MREIVVPIGVDSGDSRNAHRGEFREQRSIMADEKLILFLGRITEKKGLDLLVRAFALIARSRSDVRLVIAGPDDRGCRARVEALVRTERMSARTIFTGMLEGAEKLAVFCDADLFVLPSQSENFAVAVVEAMAHELPVVVSNRVNIWREIIEAGAGLVVNNDVQQLAGALSQMLSDSRLSKEIGRNGRRLMENRFTWERVSEQMTAVYEDIVRAGGVRGVAKGSGSTE